MMPGYRLARCRRRLTHRRTSRTSRSNGAKTTRWFDAFDDIGKAVRNVGDKTRVIAVCDREADLFELFDKQRQRHYVSIC